MYKITNRPALAGGILLTGLKPLLSFAAVLLFSASVSAATITVNTTAHEINTGPDCSLFEAVAAANANAPFGGCPAGEASPVVDQIVFNITTGGTVKTIAPTSGIPEFTDPVVIDGTTQPGAGCTGPGSLRIALNGNASGSRGFRIAAGGSGSTIKGLVFINYPGEALHIFNSSNNLIICNYIGVTAAGGVAAGNSNGIVLENGSNNTIGGITAADRNIISGNAGNGITVVQATSVGNKIFGNYVGTNAAGTAALPNSSVGISVVGATDTMIGDDVAGAGNVISGNATNGLLLNGFSGVPSTNTTVQGNIIGLNASGASSLANVGNGIFLFSTTTAQIGGTTALARNVISGNSGHGIRAIAGVNGVIIEGNLVGTDISGTLARSNASSGVLIDGSTGAVIGGSTAAQRNVFSANAMFGIDIQGVSDTVVRGNYVGTTADGLSSLGNLLGGITVSNAATTGVTIGGTGVGDGNRVTGNVGPGVYVASGTGTRIFGNEIYDNGGIGIDLGGNSSTDGVTPNDLNDTDTGANGFQNYPVLNIARFGVNTQIVGTLNSTPSRTFRIEFFSSPAADPSGFGEGRVYLGTVNVITSAGGNASFNTLLPVPTTMGHFVTATATDATANTTSEFSQARLLTQATSASVTLGGRVIDTDGRPVAKAIVVVTDMHGNLFRTFTNPFGYYSFSDVPAGETVFLNASAKGLQFTLRTVTVGDEAMNVDLIGLRIEQ